MREIYRIDPETGELMETVAQEEETAEAGSGEYPEPPEGFVAPAEPPPTLAVRPAWDEKKGRWYDAAEKDEKKLREAKREKYEEVTATMRELLSRVEAAETVEEVEGVSWEDGAG